MQGYCNRLFWAGVVLAAMGLMAIAGCSDAPVGPAVENSPAAGGDPEPPGGDPDSSGATIAGIVHGVTTEGVVPVAGARVSFFVFEERQGGSRGSFVQGGTHGSVVTNAQGEYSKSGLPPSGRAVIRASKDGHSQPCAAFHAYESPGATHDLEIYTHAALTAPDAPPPPDHSPMVSGLVFTLESGEPRPIAGARITMDLFGGMGLVGATTWSNSEGEYFLCGIPAFGAVIQATVAGFQGVKKFSIEAEDQRLDIEF